MKYVEENALYVGLDDSNHAGDSKGEIIVATFSFLHEDSLKKLFQNRRNFQKTQQWIEKPQRSYKFTILTAEKYRHSHANLVLIAPLLISSFLEGLETPPPILKIYLDGRLNPGGRERLREIFLRKKAVESVVVDNFIKKRGRHNCPPVIYHADGLASLLYREKTSEELSQSKNLVLSK